MKRSAMKKVSPVMPSRTMGIDLGDQFSHYCLLGKNGELIEASREEWAWSMAGQAYQNHTAPALARSLRL